MSKKLSTTPDGLPVHHMPFVGLVVQAHLHNESVSKLNQKISDLELKLAAMTAIAAGSKPEGNP